METNVLVEARTSYVEDPARLRALAASGLLSEDLEPALDRWTRLAATLIGAPTALLSLVERDRQYLKSAAGAPLGAEDRHTPLTHSFCRHVVENQTALVIEDAREDPLVRDNPAVAEFGVIAYAGEPVTTSDGHTLGSFCVIDTRPREWTAEELALLEDLTAGLLAELDLRAALRTSEALQADLVRQARVDVLTGLANRRQLTEDLDAAVARDGDTVLAMFDLDGFKGYNDTFGHPAGDGLLTRLGRRLERVVSSAGGTAYRLGGDEFCVLVADEAGVAAAAGTLQERGEGFAITSSYGAVHLDAAITSAEQAMRNVDQRLYRAKHGRAGARQEVQAVLLGVLREREPGLDKHVREVAVLARQVAIHLGLEASLVEEVTLAAHLHDIGKVAIPDGILEKTGPLDEEEWVIMRRHTLFGERIVGAAPGLRRVATLVRSSHERWDGAGYPDGLGGTAIPLGSRIILACDAYDAIVSDRPSAAPRTPQAAEAELRRHAGSQFDPAVAAALIAVLQRSRDLA
jgi:diguanylate cyclase (GGDEF)-like protein